MLALTLIIPIVMRAAVKTIEAGCLRTWPKAVTVFILKGIK